MDPLAAVLTLKFLPHLATISFAEKVSIHTLTDATLHSEQMNPLASAVHERWMHP